MREGGWGIKAAAGGGEGSAAWDAGYRASAARAAKESDGSPAGISASANSCTTSASSLAESAGSSSAFFSMKRSKTPVASTKQCGTTSVRSGMMLASDWLSMTVFRKRKPRPLPPSEPEPSRMKGISASPFSKFSTPEASLLRWARTSDRIQLRSQSGRSLPCASIKSSGKLEALKRLASANSARALNQRDRSQLRAW